MLNLTLTPTLTPTLTLTLILPAAAAPAPPRRRFRIKSTQLGGTLPTELGRMSLFNQGLQFSDTNGGPTDLNGTIPTQLGLMTGFKKYVGSHVLSVTTPAYPTLTPCRTCHNS